MKKAIFLAATFATLATAAYANPVLGPAPTSAPMIARPTSMAVPVQKSLLQTYRQVRTFLLSRSVIR